MLGGFVGVVGLVSRVFLHLMKMWKADSMKHVNQLVSGDAALHLHIRPVLMLQTTVISKIGPGDTTFEPSENTR